MGDPTPTPSQDAPLDAIARLAALTLDTECAAVLVGEGEEERLVGCHGAQLKTLLGARKAPGFAGFFASEPLVDSASGQLVVIDPAPRQLDARLAAALKGLAACASRELSFRQEMQARHTLGRRIVGPAVHQIRGALTSIHGFAEFLLSRKEPGSEPDEAVAIIHEQAMQLSHLVEELVQLLRVETGEDTEIVASHESLAPMIEEIAKRADVPLRLSVAKGAPQALIERERAADVLKQLLTFARDPARPEPVEVNIAPTSESGFVELIFTHRTSSIEVGDLPRIFEPFFRATQGDRLVAEGRGLARTEQLVKQLCGRMSVTALPPAGVQVALLLPAD
jgi:two-component system OmpR family sensor kinase